MAATPQDSQSWTAKGAKDAMKRTYAAVKAAIAASPSLQAHDIEVFLQGSYANSTNIRGDSDVDVVVMLKSSWYPDKTYLPTIDRIAYEHDHSPATYTASDLRHDVINALNSYFGATSVEPRNKSIRVHKSNGYVDADVVPALQHRVYLSYSSNNRTHFVEGTRLYPLKGDPIVNFPKVHKMNGREKSLNTRKNFKPTVRQIKQLKHRAIGSGRLNAKKAPGYLLECLVFNAPDDIFIDDHYLRLIHVLKWLLATDFSTFKAVDKIHRLFVDDPGKFTATDAKAVINSLADEVLA